MKLSANWMAAAGHPGEDARLYEAVQAVGVELCPALGHRDSGRQGLDVDADGVEDEAARARGHRAAVAHRHVRSRRCTDVRRALTPRARATRRRASCS